MAVRNKPQRTNSYWFDVLENPTSASGPYHFLSSSGLKRMSKIIWRQITLMKKLINPGFILPSAVAKVIFKHSYLGLGQLVGPVLSLYILPFTRA